MNRFRFVTAGAIVASLLVAGAASAQGPRRGGPGARMGGPGMALRALNLTDAQKAQIRDIREQERDTTRQLVERLQTARNAQRDAVQAVPVDEGLIRTTSQALAAVQADVAVQQAQVHNRTWAVLTPAQQEQVKTLRAERETRRDRRRPNRR
jgi:protein CpxP